MKKALCVLMILAALSGHSAQAKPVFYLNGDRAVKSIAITIDDWKKPEQLAAFLDAANAYGCLLTLYPNGINLKPEDRALWQRAIDEGHEIGNHSNTHDAMGDMTRERILRQLQLMEKNLAECLGHDHEMNTMRLPYGDGRYKGSGSAFGAALEAAGYVNIIFWDIDETTSRKILRKVQNGSIILLHGTLHDLRVLKEILPKLQEAGYSMVTVSTLLGVDKQGVRTAAATN